MAADSRGYRAPRLSAVEHSKDELARRAGVLSETAKRVLAVTNKKPEVLDAIADGRVSLADVVRDVKREEVRAQLAVRT